MNCNLCGNRCNVNRSEVTGKCLVGKKIRIAKFGLHMYEEPCISGKEGSGAIFFCGCPLRCPFCQNFEVSRNKIGKEISPFELSEIFKKLENIGANNINLVGPTHFVPEIKEALAIYRPKIPIVYNTHGYDSKETIESLDGVVDIYLPDFKYFDDEIALKYSCAKNYRETALAAIKEMRRQKKDEFDERGMMRSGVIIRHLILPKNYRDSIKVLELIKENFSETLVSVMSQFTPFGDLTNFPELSRPLFSAEIKKVEDKAVELGIKGFFQDKSSVGTNFIPSWDF